MDENSALIRLSEISFAYPGREPVFEELCLELRPGDRMGLIGPNGSGKTTLLLIIEGLLKPQSGTVEILDQPRAAEKDFYPVREKIGFMFQDPDDQLFSPTVAEDLAFGPLNQRKSKTEAMELVRETLQLLGLSGFEKRITYHLSYGEKKLVSLAAVLAMKPEILLLDEPTNGLDEQTDRRITRLLAELPQPRIVISHDREFLKQVTNKLYCLKDGRIEPA
jgi:cobalt/nickel transport system ATP-binding protein